MPLLLIKENQRRNRSQERIAKLRARPVVKALAQRERGLPLKAVQSLDLYLRLKTVVFRAAVEKYRTDVANISIQQRPATHRQWPGPYSIDQPHIRRPDLVAIVGRKRLMHAMRTHIPDHRRYFRRDFPFNVEVVVQSVTAVRILFYIARQSAIAQTIRIKTSVIRPTAAQLFRKRHGKGIADAIDIRQRKNVEYPEAPAKRSFSIPEWIPRETNPRRKIMRRRVRFPHRIAGNRAAWSVIRSSQCHAAARNRRCEKLIDYSEPVMRFRRKRQHLVAQSKVQCQV